MRPCLDLALRYYAPAYQLTVPAKSEGFPNKNTPEHLQALQEQVWFGGVN